MSQLIDNWLLSTNSDKVSIDKSNGDLSSLSYLVNLLFAYATMRLGENDPYLLKETVFSSIANIATVRKDLTELSEKEFLDYFHKLKNTDHLYIFEINKTFNLITSLIKSNDYAEMSLLFKNTKEFKKIIAEQCGVMPIVLVDNWLHPLSEFNTESNEPLNNWATANLALALASNRIALGRNETTANRQETRAYLFKYLYFNRLKSLKEINFQNFDIFFNSVVGYVDSVFLEILAELAQVVENNKV